MMNTKQFLFSNPKSKKSMNLTWYQEAFVIPMERYRFCFLGFFFLLRSSNYLDVISHQSY